MKITNINNYTPYNNSIPKVKKEEVVKPRNVDVIEINSVAKIREENINASRSKIVDLKTLKEKLANEIVADTARVKLDKIKEQINSDLFEFDADEIANLLLD